VHEKNVLFKSGYLQIKSAGPGAYLPAGPHACYNARKNLTIKISADFSSASSSKVICFRYHGLLILSS